MRPMRPVWTVWTVWTLISTNRKNIKMMVLYQSIGLYCSAIALNFNFENQSKKALKALKALNSTVSTVSTLILTNQKNLINAVALYTEGSLCKIYIETNPCFGRS